MPVRTLIAATVAAAVFIIVAASASASLAQEKSPSIGAAPSRVDVARFNDKGEMLRPDNLDNWVFVGASLGQGYNPAVFDKEKPGLFHVVRMEPSAYRIFQKTGVFPEGAMFALGFYGVQTDVPPQVSGYSTAGLKFLEVHLKDSKRFPDAGFNFFGFPAGKQTAKAAPTPNACVTCHTAHANYDGVFTQFYPVLQPFLPKAAAAPKPAAAQ